MKIETLEKANNIIKKIDRIEEKLQYITETKERINNEEWDDYDWAGEPSYSGGYLCLHKGLGGNKELPIPPDIASSFLNELWDAYKEKLESLKNDLEAL